ncbi:hypothetical protein ACJROX_04650 [Pseudalkalibacillus sp. A8]|uniref:hypothetical protein n=1 Tax=Pseudalkalibacillus sp. A8 TaxID=3382641 RepID=UPI0038B4DF8E
MSKKTFSVLSGVFFILAVFPLIAGLTRWGNKIYVAVLSISIFSPLIFSLLGLTFGLVGNKGKAKLVLVMLNILGVGLSLFLIFVATSGFQQP